MKIKSLELLFTINFPLNCLVFLINSKRAIYQGDVFDASFVSSDLILLNVLRSHL